jgi:hypothetical protein
MCKEFYEVGEMVTVWPYERDYEPLGRVVKILKLNSPKIRKLYQGIPVEFMSWSEDIDEDMSIQTNAWGGWWVHPSRARPLATGIKKLLIDADLL